MIFLLYEGVNLLALATDCLDVPLDLVLLGIQTLFELHFVSLAVAEAPGGIAVGFPFLGLA